MSLETLYLIRHAQAVSADEDPERPLSGRGQRQAQYLVAALRELDLQVDIVYHSEKARAAETAAVLGPAFAAQQGTHARRDLEPHDPVDAFLEDLSREEWKQVAVVGHLPFLERLAARLLAGDSEQRLLRFPEATIAALVRGPQGWDVRWIVQPPASL